MDPSKPVENGFALPRDLVPVHTADGSSTLDSPALREHYHSLHGAATESRHVFIQHGLLAAARSPVDVLEVGLGTGLNALLAWQAAERAGRKVNYMALEPFPLPKALWQQLGHVKAIDEPGMEAGYETLMEAEPGRRLSLSASFSFERRAEKVQDLDLVEAFDVVFHDAFAPSIQPEMWTLPVFQRLFRALRPGGILVTYCAKGDVRRAMQAAGFRVERLPGAPGKRHMVRAWR